MAVSKHMVMRISSALLLMVVALSLFFAESAYWINHTVFNKANFSQTITTELQKDSSRQAIATAVVNKALEERPIVQRVIGERAISFTSGLLGSDVSAQAMKTITDKTYAYVTAPNRDDVKIDLTTVNTALDTLITLAQTQGKGDRLVAAEAKIPDEIVLIQSDTFPDLSGFVKTMLWVGPVLWLLFIASSVLYVYIGREQYARRIYALGITIGVVAVLGLFVMPFIPSALAAALPTIALRPVAENVATGFLLPFRGQMLVLLGITTIVLIVFNQRYNILKGAQAMSAKLTSSRADDSRKPKSKK